MEHEKVLNGLQEINEMVTSKKVPRPLTFSLKSSL